MLLVEESSCVRLKTRTLFSFLSQPDPSRVGKTLRPSCKNCMLSCHVPGEGKLQGNPEMHKPICGWLRMAFRKGSGIFSFRWPSSTENECLHPVLSADCVGLELQVWDTGLENTARLGPPEFLCRQQILRLKELCVCAHVRARSVYREGCETCMCWPRCPSSMLFHEHLLECSFLK